jgi:hypothetical protein
MNKLTRLINSNVTLSIETTTSLSLVDFIRSDEKKSAARKCSINFPRPYPKTWILIEEINFGQFEIQVFSFKRMFLFRKKSQLIYHWRSFTSKTYLNVSNQINCWKRNKIPFVRFIRDWITTKRQFKETFLIEFFFLELITILDS